MTNSLDRFTARADDYSQARPSYPSELIDALINRRALAGKPLVVDVGSGTGISSAYLAQYGLEVIAVEPNADMRRRAMRDMREGVRIVDGTAESTGLSSSVADLVCAFQSFHWFDPSRSLSEFARILKPTGKVGLIWNVRSDADVFTRQYGAIVDRYSDERGKDLKNKELTGEALAKSTLFTNCIRLAFPYVQVLRQDLLIARLRSVSYLPKAGPRFEEIALRLTSLFEDHQASGTVTMVYDTVAYIADRKP